MRYFWGGGNKPKTTASLADIRIKERKLNTKMASYRNIPSGLIQRVSTRPRTDMQKRR